MRHHTIALSMAAALTAGTALAAPSAAFADTKAPAAASADTLQGRHLRRCPEMPITGTPTHDQRRAVRALDRLDYLAGNWAGTGWSAGKDGKADISQTEVIRRIGNGEEMMINGKAVDPKNPATVLFTASARLTWAGRGYTWHATSGGADTTVPFRVNRDGWQWDVEVAPGITTRYVMTTDTHRRTWHETGDITRDGGKTWNRILEMDLVKTCDAGLVDHR